MRFQIGDIEVVGIDDMPNFPFPMAEILPGRSLEELRAHEALLAPDHVDFERDMLLLDIRSFVLRVDGINILVDTCVGEEKERPARPAWHQRQDTGYLDRLAAAGFTPEDIDIVFCTHLHGDHVGWNTRMLDGRWVPTFPRARYLTGRGELAFWQARGDKAPPPFFDSVQPLLEAGCMDTVDDGYEIAKGITLKPLPGHTPGQMGLYIERAGAKALMAGDAIHSPVQVLRPDWSTGFCVDAEQAASTRRTFLECAAAEDWLLVPAHFRACACARITRKGEEFTPVFTT